MKIDYIVKKIHENSFYDYSQNVASDSVINTYVQTVFQTFNIKLDEEYLEFLKQVNGFEINGLNFYGTDEQKHIYILSAIKQNIFWSIEIASLKNYFLVADGDMDFYCFEPNEKKYLILSKASLEKLAEYQDFNAFITEVTKTYVPNIESNYE